MELGDEGYGVRVEREEVMDMLGKDVVNGSCICGGVDATDEVEEEEDMGLLVDIGSS